ncbi:hypothetical protein AGR2A_Cc30291 [Agrobacterium genomosp. 2 str. CFBP 5494]|uniref:Uncharacterized protein n=1 Tax=Agrobacterium genomosp. 2 str. CFBP 5494 TaxID=1183436 RepID=A0A9W5F453_9HYPH|nr:hypothetical protein AGR2A_Cc30291 [Agrobacterium genomosp. 2 str. CFBP 5494]
MRADALPWKVFVRDNLIRQVLAVAVPH